MPIITTRFEAIANNLGDTKSRISLIELANSLKWNNTTRKDWGRWLDMRDSAMRCIATVAKYHGTQAVIAVLQDIGGVKQVIVCVDQWEALVSATYDAVVASDIAVFAEIETRGEGRVFPRIETITLAKSTTLKNVLRARALPSHRNRARAQDMSESHPSHFVEIHPVFLLQLMVPLSGSQESTKMWHVAACDDLGVIVAVPFAAAIPGYFLHGMNPGVFGGSVVYMCLADRPSFADIPFKVLHSERQGEFITTSTGHRQWMWYSDSDDPNLRLSETGENAQ